LLELEIKETWEKMSRAEKKTQFKEYYLTPLLIGIMVICIAGYLIYDAVSSYRDIVLLTAVINDHFDEEWNRLPFYAVYKNSNKDIARPKQMDDLIKFSKILSEGIPHLRVDWYVVDGHIYFGEMTFYTWAGYMQMVPDEWDTILGDMIELPPVTIE